MEYLSPSPEYLATHYQVIHSLDQGIAEYGMQDADFWSLAHQIAGAVNVYNADHPHEMLAKTAEMIYAQLESGHSVILATQTEAGWQFLYHCAAYELLEPGQSQALDHWQVMEIGTAITHPLVRKNYGIGRQGTEELLSYLDRHFDGRYVAIATIKQFVTGNMFRHVRGAAVRWSDHPYLAFLTDSCDDLTPTQTGAACSFRRSEVESSDSDLHNVTSARGGHMPCTLIVFQPDRARLFDDLARAGHEALCSAAIPIGTNDQTQPEAWRTMHEYFQLLSGRVYGH